jgi:hypothetical protein
LAPDEIDLLTYDRQTGRLVGICPKSTPSKGNGGDNVGDNVGDGVADDVVIIKVTGPRDWGEL